MISTTPQDPAGVSDVPDWAMTAGSASRPRVRRTPAIARSSRCWELSWVGIANPSPMYRAFAWAVARNGTSRSASATPKPIAATGTAQMNTWSSACA